MLFSATRFQILAINGLNMSGLDSLTSLLWPVQSTPIPLQVHTLCAELYVKPFFLATRFQILTIIGLNMPSLHSFRWFPFFAFDLRVTKRNANSKLPPLQVHALCAEAG